jgi:integral membrane protein (TIGR01906 family)
MIPFLYEAAEYGMKTIVVHASAEPITDEERPAKLAACARSYDELREIADRLGVRLACENLPRTCLSHTTDETLMLAATHSAQRYLGGSAATADKSEQGKRDMWNGLLDNLGDTAITSAFTLEAANETADRMAAYSDAFALDANAIRHLDDCNVLIQKGVYVVQVFGVIFLVCLVVLLIMRQRHAIGLMLSVAPVLLILAFLAMGVYAFLDFRSFFSAFHGVFFPQGNWTFSYESLLICMYPTEFWMGMGAVWLFTTLLASIILLVIGRKVLRSAR